MKYSKSNSSRCDDGLLDINSGPICRTHVLSGITAIHTGLSRDGLMYRKSELTKYVVTYAWACSTESAFMNVMEQLKDTYDEAEKLWGTYKDKLTSFRSAIKNDVVSLEAAARKTTEAVHRMNGAYGAVIAQMNGPEMQAAIANAERLATAMTALANLQPHKLTLAVIDQSPDASTASAKKAKP